MFDNTTQTITNYLKNLLLSNNAISWITLVSTALSDKQKQEILFNLLLELCNILMLNPSKVIKEWSEKNV